ncbi:MAG: transposase [Cyanobacteria bacterium J06621_8]
MILFESQSTTISSGGGSGPPVKASVDQQNKLLALTKNLGNSDIQVPEITVSDVTQRTNTFTNTFDALLQDVDTQTMNEQQITSLREGIKTDTNSALGLAIGTLITPGLNNINSPQFDRRMINATKSGICESLDGGKNTKGRKRHILVDTMGLMLMVVVTAANISDQASAKALFARLKSHRRWLKRLFLIYTDGTRCG